MLAATVHISSNLFLIRKKCLVMFYPSNQPTRRTKAIWLLFMLVMRPFVPCYTTFAFEVQLQTHTLFLSKAPLPYSLFFNHLKNIWYILAVIFSLNHTPWIAPSVTDLFTGLLPHIYTLQTLHSYNIRLIKSCTFYPSFPLYISQLDKLILCQTPCWHQITILLKV